MILNNRIEQDKTLLSPAHYQQTLGKINRSILLAAAIYGKL